MAEKGYRVGSFEFSSRLFVGTGKYDSFGLMKECLEASDAQVVTVAIRRDVLTPDGQAKPESILDHLDMQRYTILPNTAGCFTAKDAIRSARLRRELLDGLGARDQISLGHLSLVIDALRRCRLFKKIPDSRQRHTCDRQRADSEKNNASAVNHRPTSKRREPCPIQYRPRPG